MALYIFARFEPKPGQASAVRDELMRVLELTRAEPGCVRIHLYESTRDPLVFVIHSEWTDAAAFEAHVELPHTQRMVSLVEPMLANPLQAIRSQQIY
ncbi:MAG: putative quinol monooxygenase [Bryobacteraceae bacterium]|jgi:quinol monooxygenase YgiN